MPKPVLPASLAALALVLLAIFAIGAITGDGGAAPPAAPTETPQAETPVDGDVPTDRPTEAPPSRSPDTPRSGGETPPAALDSPRSGGDTPAPSSGSHLSTPEPGRTLALAPIDAAAIAALESYPARYVLQVKAGLPGGCAKSSGYTVGRTGDVIEVSVFNTLPATPVPCTLIYGQYDLSIDLGSAFMSGREYVVEVNGKRVSFEAR